MRVYAVKPYHETYEVCDHGTKHPVVYVEVRELEKTDKTREYNNGYYKREEPLWKDRLGRLYESHPPIDFHGSTAYVRDDDKAMFSNRVPYPLGFVRLEPVVKDALGRVLR